MTVLVLVATASATQASSSQTQLVSVAVGGGAANNASFIPSVSGDGRFVAFESDASDLVVGDGNGEQDVFVRDTGTGATQRIVNATLSGGSSVYFNSMSASGRFLVYTAYALAGGQAHVYLRDLLTNADTPLFKPSTSTAISPNGQWVVAAHSSGLMVRYNRLTGQKRYRHIRGTGGFAFGISNDGRTVLVDDLIWKPRSGRVFRYDQSFDGDEANEPVFPNALSANGRFVMFTSKANNIVVGDTNGGKADVFVRDLLRHRTRRISLSSSRVEGNRGSEGLDLSSNGRYALFSSGATNLVRGDTNGIRDLFLRDRRFGTTRRCSLSTSGDQANGESIQGALSPEGSYIAFISIATNLITPSTTRQYNVFLRGLGC